MTVSQSIPYECLVGLVHTPCRITLQGVSSLAAFDGLLHWPNAFEMFAPSLQSAPATDLALSPTTHNTCN